MARYGYLDNIKIYDQVTTKSLPFDAATPYATFYWNKTVAIPTGVTALTGTLNDDNTILTLSEVSGGYIPAYTPVILRYKKGETLQFDASSEAKEAIASSLKGSLIEHNTADVTGGNVYVLGYSQTDASDLAFHPYTGTTLGANKAYLVVPASSAVPSVRVQFGAAESSVTGLSSIAPERQAQGQIYDLLGRRLHQAPARGMYIVDGKKVVR